MRHRGARPWEVGPERLLLTAGYCLVITSAICSKIAPRHAAVQAVPAVVDVNEPHARAQIEESANGCVKDGHATVSRGKTSNQNASCS
jgi:hypothetical protein